MSSTTTTRPGRTLHSDVDLLNLQRWDDLPELATRREAVEALLTQLRANEAAQRDAAEHYRLLVMGSGVIIGAAEEGTTLREARHNVRQLVAAGEVLRKQLSVARGVLELARQQVRQTYAPALAALAAPVTARLQFLDSVEALYRLLGKDVPGAQYRAAYAREAVALRQLLMALER